MYIKIPQGSKHIDEFVKQLRIRGRSEKTVLGYVQSLDYFLKYHKGIRPSELTIRNIHNYQLHLCQRKKHANAYVNSQTAAIKFFCRYVLNKDWNFDLIPYMKDTRSMPVVMSKLEISRLLRAAMNIKHRTMFSTMYATGMRPAELLNLRVSDIHTSDKVIHVRHGKGSKDRYVMLSGRLLIELRHFWMLAKPHSNGLLFTGENQKVPMQVDSLSMAFRRLKVQANVREDAHLYSLRHSFATHLLEQGVDLRVIQKLMGHADIASTCIYLQVAKEFVAKVVSPFDTVHDRKSTHAPQ